jgi:beta-xylosidase
MRGSIQPCKVDSAPTGSGVFATRESDTVWNVLLWNHQMMEVKNQPTWCDTLHIGPVPQDRYEIISARIRPGAGSAWETWCNMGCPHNLALEEEYLLRAHSVPEYAVALQLPAEGKLAVPFKLEPGEVVYMQCRPVGVAAMGRTIPPELLRKWEADQGAKSK